MIASMELVGTGFCACFMMAQYTVLRDRFTHGSFSNTSSATTFDPGPDSGDRVRARAQTDDASMKEKVMDVEGAKDEAMLNFRRDSRNMLSILLMFFSKLLAVAFRYNMKVSDNNKNNNDDDNDYNDDVSDGG